MLTMVRRRMARLEALTASSCPACASWPEEVAVRIVEEIIEPGQPLPPPAPAAPNPWDGPCPCCGRLHKPRVVAILGE
jgi:hypothetical protein